LTFNIIKESFEETGIMPFNEEKMMKHASESISHSHSSSDKLTAKLEQLFTTYLDIISLPKNVKVQKIRVGKKKSTMLMRP
jgi:hypothetical protein